MVDFIHLSEWVGWHLKLVQMGPRQLPLPGTHEQQPVRGVRRAQTGRLPQRLANLAVHHLDGSRLPVEDLLHGLMRRVALGEHGNHDVGREALIVHNFRHYFLDELGRNRVVTVCFVVEVPCISRAHEILVLDVHEVLGITNHLRCQEKQLFMTYQEIILAQT